MANETYMFTGTPLSLDPCAEAASPDALEQVAGETYPQETNSAVDPLLVETPTQREWRLRDRRSIVQQEKEETYKGEHKFSAWDEPCDGAWKEKRDV